MQKRLELKNCLSVNVLKETKKNQQFGQICVSNFQTTLYFYNTKATKVALLHAESNLIKIKIAKKLLKNVIVTEKNYLNNLFN